jgi:tellurite methyltransferase
MISFEEHYKKEKCYWGLKPDKFIVEILKYKSSGSLLDLGTGEGRNAIFLAKKGFDVTGVDISSSGIKKFLSLAKKLKVKVKGIVQDITKFKFDKKYDVIISTATLHFLPKSKIKSVINKMKKYTKEDGLNLISVFTVKDPGFKKSKKIYYFKEGELKKFYEDKNWKILKYKEFITKPERHGKDGKWHRHGIAILLARKTK